MADNQLGKGRKKISMKQIENDDDRLITFSKRRTGIYKKATEISTLCGTDIGVLIFSPAGNPFCYGIPNIESVSSRLLHGVNYQDQLPGDAVMESLEGHRRTKLEELNRTSDDLNNYLLTVTKEGESLAEEQKKLLEEGGKEAPYCWWDIPVEDLKAEEMENLTSTMEQIHKNACSRHRDLLDAAFPSSSSTAASQSEVGSSYPNDASTSGDGN